VDRSCSLSFSLSDTLTHASALFRLWFHLRLPVVLDRLSFYIQLKVHAKENEKRKFWDIAPHDIVRGIEARIGKGTGGTVSKCKLWQVRSEGVTLDIRE
jgi:hypothetical protein